MGKQEIKSILSLLQYDVIQNKKINTQIIINDITLSLIEKNKNIEISVYNSSKKYIKNRVLLERNYSVEHFKILSNKELNFVSFLINKAY